MDEVSNKNPKIIKKKTGDDDGKQVLKLGGHNSQIYTLYFSRAKKKYLERF